VISTFVDYYLLTGAYTESLNKTIEFAKIYYYGYILCTSFRLLQQIIFCTGGSQPKRNVASPVIEFGFQLYIRFLFTK
jgi:hypothetical protein